MTFNLNKPVASDVATDEGDIRQLKVFLNRFGYYTPDKAIGMNGIPDRAMFEAVKVFQKGWGIPASGQIRPGDETENAIREMAESKKAKPKTYIWRSVGDDKVREEHAALDGIERSFDEEPTPGSDPNCRCWAEPAVKRADCEEQEIAYANASAAFFIAEQNLRKAEIELAKLIDQNFEKEKELKIINNEINKEKEDKKSAKVTGAGIGAIGGAILGAPGGAGGSAALAGIGIGLGGNTARILEEIKDAIDPNAKTDLILGLIKQKLIKEIEQSKLKIQDMKKKIASVLVPKYKANKTNKENRRKELQKCLSKHEKSN